MAVISRSVHGRKHPRNPGAVDDVNAFTKALLHFDGANGSQTFTDEMGTSWTHVGNPALDSSVSRFGPSCFKSDGIGDGLYPVVTPASFALGLDDFTIDFWLRLNETGVTKIIFDMRPATSGTYIRMEIHSTNKIHCFGGSLFEIIGTTALSAGPWHHLAMVRYLGQTKFYLNGINEGSTYADTNDYICGTNRPLLMNGYDSNYSYSGWMDEFRLTKGVARWISNFNPPSSAYTDTA